MDQVRFVGLQLWWGVFYKLNFQILVITYCSHTKQTWSVNITLIMFISSVPSNKWRTKWVMEKLCFLKRNKTENPITMSWLSMELDLVQTSLKYSSSKLPCFFWRHVFSGTTYLYNAVFANVQVILTPLKIFKAHAKFLFLCSGLGENRN